MTELAGTEELAEERDPRRARAGVVWAAVTLTIYVLARRLFEGNGAGAVEGSEADAVNGMLFSVAVVTVWVAAWLLLGLCRRLLQAAPAVAASLDGPRWRPEQPMWRWVQAAMVATVAAMVVEGVIEAVLRNGPPPASYADLPTGSTATTLAARAVDTVLAGPVEEPVFRGVVMGLMLTLLLRFLPSRWAAAIAAVVSSAVFVWPHVAWAGELSYDAIAGLCVFTSGLFFAWLAIRYGLAAAVAAHSAGNAAVMAVSLHLVLGFLVMTTIMLLAMVPSHTAVAGLADTLRRRPTVQT